MSASEMRQRISGLRRRVPVPVQGASTRMRSKVLFAKGKWFVASSRRDYIELR